MNIIKGSNWDIFFLDMAKYYSTKSKDPSTQTGAVIINKLNEVQSCGFNGFARGILDIKERYLDREYKYLTIAHCEINCIISAKKDLTDCTLYTYPFCSCANCSTYVIQAGIKRCVAPKLPDHLIERWGKNTSIAAQQFKEAGVQLDILDYK